MTRRATLRDRAKYTVVLVDTNVVMEAVRTHCWNAMAGGLWVETVEECREEALRGDRGHPPLLQQHTERWLSQVRTGFLLAS